MKFAHFAHIWGKTGLSPHERYEMLWRELQLADELGFDYGFCVEHHFRPDESWMSSPNLYAVGAGARTRNLRIGAMGFIVPLYNSLRLAEEIAITDQMLGGRFEVGLVPGISPTYFEPFGMEYDERRTPTLEYVDYLRAAYGDAQPFSFMGDHHQTESAQISVQPAQRPHPPLWMYSRDPETLEFCAREGLNTGYFLSVPRAEAAPRYVKFLEDWKKAGWDRTPKIGYSSVVYVDETDEIAIDKALYGASRAYQGFLAAPQPGESFEDRVQGLADRFTERGEHGAAKIMGNLFDADFIMANDLMFIGSPATVTAKLKEAASSGMFNTFLGEFNFHDLPEKDVMNSIRLFGKKVMPELRGFEPF